MRFALALLGLLATTPAHAECAVSGLDPVLVTVSGQTLPSTGGLLIATEVTRTGSLAPGDVVLQTAWRFNGRTDKPTVVSLAPGLAVMRVPAGKAELVDAKGKSLVTVTGGGDASAIAAPKVTSIKVATRDLGYHGMGTTVTVTFEKLPRDIGAVIVLDAKTKKPRSFGLTHEDPSQVVVYSVGRCKPLPNGTVATAAGDSVMVAFVDSSGRMSPPSAAVTVTKEPPKP